MNSQSVSVALFASIAMLACGWRIADADELTFGGSKISGKVTAVNGSSVEFEPADGKGKVTVDHEKIENLTSESTYYVVYGEEGEVSGTLVGVEDNYLLVQDESGAVTRVDLTTVTYTEAADAGPSLLGGLRSTFRYWSAHFDLGFNSTNSTTDTLGFSLATGATRKKGPFKLHFEAGMNYGTQKKKDQNQELIENDFSGLIRGDYDVTERIYGFGAADGLYDGIQALSLRTVPKAGLGYHFIKEKDMFLDGEVGGSWVYEKYFGGDDNNYFAIVFGAATEVPLPFGAKFTGRTDFLPAVDAFTEDFLWRGLAELAFPMTRDLSLKLSVLDEYDNTPAFRFVPAVSPPGTVVKEKTADNNKLVVTIGVSLVF